jgi:RNA polymerase sigma-70 factor (ECF subfamily)
VVGLRAKTLAEQRTTDEFIMRLADCQNRLYAYVLSLLPDPELARDVVQEANVVMWRKAAEFKPGTSFESWACKIAYFEVLVARRKLKRDRHLFSDDLVQQLSLEAESKLEGFTDREVALEECLRRLEPEQRRHLQARYGQGGSVKNVAEVARVTNGAAAVLLYRIRKALRACVENKLAMGGGRL